MGEQFSFNELINTEQKKITVDSIEINTFERTVNSVNILSVEVGTTGHRGGDSARGGRTYLKFEDHGSTDIMARTDRQGDFYTIASIELRLGGDRELDSLIDALEFAVKILKTQREPKG